MPTKVEKDTVTGTETTGHEWDGIKELDNPLPKWWLWVFYATVIWAIAYYVLFPTIPGWDGVLGYSSRVAVTEKLAEARQAQAGYLERIAASDVGTIAADSQLRSFAIAGSRAVFAENCQPCHGAGGAGQAGYPSLADDVWLWGGGLDAIHTTLLHGIRWNQDADSRYAEMPAFGRDELLGKEQIRTLAAYVAGMSDNSYGPGRGLYAEQCAACHGSDGSGLAEFGAPALNDAIWLYGGSEEEIAAQIHSPRHGVMPAWSGRLDESTIKMLTVYVHALGGGE